MVLSPIETYLILLLFCALYASYVLHKVKTKIYYHLVREDDSVKEGWVGFIQQKIMLDLGKGRQAWFFVEPQRIVNRILDKGFPFLFFPTRVPQLYFSYTSERPIDMRSFENQWPTPEARPLLDKTDDIQAYHEGNKRALGTAKPTLIQQYAPLLTVVGFIIIGYVLWIITGKLDQYGAQFNYIEGLLGQILKK